MRARARKIRITVTKAGISAQLSAGVRTLYPVTIKKKNYQLKLTTFELRALAEIAQELREWKKGYDAITDANDQ